MQNLIQKLKSIGIVNPGKIQWNLNSTQLVEEAIKDGEGMLTRHGALSVTTGAYTGRSPNDKFVVREPSSEKDVWWGKVNVETSEENYLRLRSRAQAYFQRRKLYVEDLFVGCDPKNRLYLRMISPVAWSSAFARNMFGRPSKEELVNFQPDFYIIHSPYFKCDIEIDKVRSEAAVMVNFGKREVLVCGTEYGGEIKKSIFTVMNYFMPKNDVLSMHCSANYGKDKDDVSLFFGLSATGKTTLSIDSARTLIGDDEHGWSKDGIFNFEGGCYAKTIRLSKENEPEIFEATHMLRTILENVKIDPVTRVIDLDSDELTENTRASFPITSLPIADQSGICGHPKYVFFLACDAFGVLPPISILTPEQAVYYFLLGYTAKVAGTERGITEPQATFSACFGAPFMVHNPSVYAKMLADRVRRHNSQVYLINTGWTGGPYGVGSRFKLPYTRAIVHAAQRGELVGAETEEAPILGLQVPKEVKGVPAEILQPRNTWSDSEKYDEKAKELVGMFNKAFGAFRDNVSDAVRAVEPKL